MKYDIIKLSSLSDNYNLRLCYTDEKPGTVRSLVGLLDYIDVYESGNRPKGGIVHFEGSEFAISLGGEQIGRDGSVDLTNVPIVPLDYYKSCKKGFVRSKDILVCKDGALTGKCLFMAT